MGSRLLLQAHAAPCLQLFRSSTSPAKVKIQRWMALSQRRSFSHVEVSPSNHGTKPLKILADPKRLHPLLVQQLIRRYPELENPTPIQAHAIPLLLGGTSLSSRDVMLRSATGSGKTLALGLPLLDRLFRSTPSGRVPFALIVNPTRELAQQTAQVLESLVPITHAFSVALATGGAEVASQREILRHAHIVVGTPGRILQFLDDRSLSLHHCQFVAIDEADRLLDMGFEPQLQRIARALRRNQQHDQNDRKQQLQTVLCSATFPPAVQRLGSLFLKSDYFFVAASSSANNSSNATASSAVGREALHASIQHKFVWYDEQQQLQQRRQGGPKSHLAPSVQSRANVVLEQIQEFIKNGGNPRQRILAFCNTKIESKRLATFLKDHSSYKVLLVTGDQAQPARQRALDMFRRSNTKSTIVLVATDVAARGLDVPGIGLVLQAEAPREYDTYVHRAGRTGRAGATGTAVTFLSGQNRVLALDLVQAAESNSTVTKNVDIPSWLRGMAHVARAQQSVEEDAIAAGTGGGDEFSLSSSTVAAATEADSNDNESDSSSTSQYSAVDFRSQADRGSWGRDRDTSFQNFEQEAYRDWDAAAFLTDSGKSFFDEDQHQTEPEESSVIDVDENMLTDDDSLFEVDADSTAEFGDVDDVVTVPVDRETGASFPRPPVSQGLQDALLRITGSDELGATPSRSVLEALARVRTNPHLRYEYIGMFPFEDMVDLLVDRQRDAADSPRSGMLRVLMVAEKPSIAKSIADALSGPNGPRQRRGISRALPVYEFTTDKFAPAAKDPLNSDRNNSQVVCVVTSVVGHIFSLGFAPSSGDNQKLDPVEFFDMPVVKKEEASTGKLRVVDHLRALAGECDHLVLWLDCDAEGENIAFETIGVTRRAFEQKMEKELSLHEQSESGTYEPVRRIHRARFSAITREALRNAFQNIGEPNAALSRSVDARQELDLRVGVAMSRLLTWRCVGLARRKYSDATKLVSYGPCQTPTLSFCVDRARAIEAFESQVYWKVNASASFAGAKAGKVYELRWRPPLDPVECTSTNMGFRKRDDSGKQHEESSTLDKQSVDEVLRRASLPGSFLQVNSVVTESERIFAPVGLNTVALLSAGSKSMGMSPKQVMTVAEKLYSSGYISYPRTETTRYDPTGFDVRKILFEHANHPEWGRTASNLFRTRFSSSGKPPARGKDAGDHPPITCLRSATREQIGGGAAWRVYEFVARTMLGSFSDDLRITRSVAELALVVRQETELSPNYVHLFEMETVIVDSLGFAGACPWVLNDIGAQRKDDELNFLVKGMRLLIHKIRPEKKRTRPPTFLQEHELIELMDRNGVGTDASMATHVSNITDRGYVVLCDESGVPLRPPRPGQPRQIGRYLVPTPLGMALMYLLGEEASGSTEISGPHGVAMLARPEIRARMEAECKLIAEGRMDKDTCLRSNLDWFRTRYQQLADSLTYDFLKDKFAPNLCPLKDALQYWRRKGAFEPRTPTAPPGNQGGNRGLATTRQGESDHKNKASNRSVRRTPTAVSEHKKQQGGNRRVGTRKDAPDFKNVQAKEGKTHAKSKTKIRPRFSKLITKG